MLQDKERRALEAIREEMEGLPGHLGLYYRNLVTGATFEVRAREPFLAASVIKFPLYLHILARAAEGEMSMEERLVVAEGDKLPSCGALSLFTGEVAPDVATLCRLMICLSDNTATNRLIRRCGMEEVNRSFGEMGLEHTVLRRLLFDAEASAAGLQNTVSPAEMGLLLEKLHRGEFVNEKVSREALDVLCRQQIGHKMGGRLRGQLDIAHKTGEDTGLSNDVGIVYAARPFVLCFTGHDTDVYHWEDLMRRGTYELVLAQEEAR